MTGAGTEREYERNGTKTKMNLTELKGDGLRDNLLFQMEISALVTKPFLFKVEFKNIVNSKFDHSFCVKRLCNDPEVFLSHFLCEYPDSSFLQFSFFVAVLFARG